MARKQIPVYRHGNVVGTCTVDTDDWNRVIQEVGTLRWKLRKDGYVYSHRPGKGGPTILLHRVVLGLTPGDGLLGDHIDRNKLNNTSANLRPLEPSESQHNLPSYPGSSRFRGVSWNRLRGKWSAQVKVRGKKYHLGLFDDEQEAAEVAKLFRLSELAKAVD